jgi:hypothetical protein
MTNEQNTEELDRLVSDTYRELSQEQTPEQLNQAILQMAAAANTRGGARGALFSAWMKPVAAAATIGLTLAIVLELTEVPSAIEQQSIAPGVVIEDEPLAEIDLSEVKSKGTLNAFTPSLNAFTPSAPGGVLPAAKTTDAGSVIALEESAVENIAQKERAARSMASDSSTSFAVSSDLAAEPKKDSDTADACDALARQSAKSWLTCIEELRDSGANELADLEYRALINEYPLETADLEANK